MTSAARRARPGAARDLGAHEYQAALAVISGDNQRTDAFTPFPDPLVVGASSSWGDEVEGLVVHFTPFVSDPGGKNQQLDGGYFGRAGLSDSHWPGRPSGFSVEATAPGFNTG